MSDKSEVYLPLMSRDLELTMEESTYDNIAGKTRRSVGKRDVLMLTIIIVQAVSFILLLLAFWNSGSSCEQTANSGTHFQLYSPANVVLEDQIKVFVDGFAVKTIYQEYSDEGDQAWQDLYSRTLMKIPRSEAVLLPNKTWPIKEFPGYYVGQLDVFHQLHCVNKVRQALRHDRYDQILQDPDGEFDPKHLSHCIDSIRQYVMCHSDPSVLVWQWNPEYLVVEPRFEYPRMCKNFEKVRAWASERHIDKFIDLNTYIEDDLPTPAIIYQ